MSEDNDNDNDIPIHKLEVLGAELPIIMFQ